MNMVVLAERGGGIGILKGDMEIDVVGDHLLHQNTHLVRLSVIEDNINKNISASRLLNSVFRLDKSPTGYSVQLHI